MKKLFLLLFLFFVFLSIGSSTLAQVARPLEVQYPIVPEVPTPTTVETELPNYVKYIFNFFIWASGFIALVVLVIAGFQYLSSAGRPEVLKDAKNRIFSATTGLLLLLSSWLILTTINPQLTNLKIKKTPATLSSLIPGIYLCKQKDDGTTVREVERAWIRINEIKKMSPDDQGREPLIKQVEEYLKVIEKYCWRVPTQGEIPEKFNDLAKIAYVVPSETTLYGAILYEESKFGGRSQVIYKWEFKEPLGFDITKIEPSSVRPFILKQPRPEVYVEAYELIDFNKAESSKKSKKYTISGLVSSKYEDLSYFSYKEKTKVGSAKIEGDLIVIFFKDAQSGFWPPDAILDVAVNTDANFYDNLMGRWCWEPAWTLWEYYPCPKQMVIVSGGIY